MNGNGIFMTREAGTPSHKNPHTQCVLVIHCITHRGRHRQTIDMGKKIRKIVCERGKVGLKRERGRCRR